MEFKHLSVPGRQEEKIKNTISEITQIIEYMNKLLNSNDVNFVSAYKSKISELRMLPSKVTVALPKYIPLKRSTKLIVFSNLVSVSIIF